MKRLKEVVSRGRLEIALLVAVLGIVWAWCEVPGSLTAGYSGVAQRGAFGDTYGTVTALFTGLAFALLIYTALLQRQELGLQRKELHDTRRELKGQGDTLKLQRFEHTFFQLLRAHVDIVSALSMPVERPHSNPGVYGTETSMERGRRCLWEKRGQLKQEFDGTYPGLEDLRRDEGDAHELTINMICDKVLQDPEVEPHLGHYFRQLYHIIKFVDESEIEDKRRYTDFLQAQMDNDELVLLAYNGISEQGEDFKPLIERYSLLENLAAKSFFNEEHCEFYEKAAFGNNVYRHGIEFS